MDRARDIEAVDRARDIEAVDRARDIEAVDRARDIEAVDRARKVDFGEYMEDSQDNSLPLWGRVRGGAGKEYSGRWRWIKREHNSTRKVVSIVKNCYSVVDKASAGVMMSDNTAQQRRAWWVVLTAALFFFFEFINMNSFDPLNAMLRESFNVDALAISHLSAMYFYANVIFLIPAGLILDRYSARKCLLLALAACITCDILFSYTHDMTVAKLCRFFTGLASTFCLLGCAKLTSKWFPSTMAGLVMGTVVTVAMIGGMLAQYLGIVTEWIGSDWRVTFRLIASLGIGIWLLMFWIVQDAPDHQVHEKLDQEHEHLNSIGTLSALKEAAQNPQTWLCGLYTNLMSIPIVVLGGLWAIPFLNIVYGLSDTEAASVSLMIFFGVMVGSPLSGWVSDTLRSRRTPLIVGAVLTLLVALVIHQGLVGTHIGLMLLFFLLGLFCSVQVITYAVVIECNPPYLTASSESISATVIMSCGAIFQPLFGSILSWSSNAEGTYTVISFYQAMWILTIGCVAALLTGFLIKESSRR